MDETNNGSHYFIDGYSINRKNTIKLLEQAFGPGHDEKIAKIDAWNSARNRANMASNKLALFVAYQEICAEFYAGRITAEECAKQVQERVEIYLKE